ncbi:hypothetical protein DRN63_01575 [Nanoarchaeota archaeon]|nr:MAG: hypothetical protein DRN63_01575 [Nanoarchaeota archaeon]
MIDKEYLQDYSEREKELLQKFMEKLNDGLVSKDDVYPSTERLPIVRPYTFSIPRKKIWFQLPFYGTLIVPLRPISDPVHFSEVHGFDLDDIERLIELSKKKRKVQFVLADNPTLYAPCDFLESILLELKPPQFFYFPLESEFPFNVESESIKDMIKEDPDSYDFYSQAKICGFYQFLKQLFEEIYYRPFTEEIFGGYAQAYSRLKRLGHDKLADAIINKMLVDFYEAYALFKASLILILEVYTNPLKPIISLPREVYDVSLEKLLEHENLKTIVKPEFPYEIGRFLTRKTKGLVVPKNCEGAIEMDDRFETNKLRDLLQKINKAIEKHDVDKAEENVKEIEEILEYFWAEADKIRALKEKIRIGLAVIGSLATVPLSGLPGLLTGLGFSVADKIMDKVLWNSISEKLAKWMKPDHLVVIYDFKKTLYKQ